MFFTKDDFLKIEEWLKQRTVKDSEFNTVYELSPEDFIPVLCDLNNAKISVRDLYKGIGKNNVINYHEYVGNYNIPVSLKEAINAIKEQNRIPGSIITFISSTTKQWETYQYNSFTINDWLNEGYWRNILGGDNNKFKGFFPNEILLFQECPLPYVGDYAYVGATLGEALIYTCIERGTWTKTQELVISNSAALLR